MTSARFTPAATTSRTTSPLPGWGSGCSVHSRTSGPPGSRMEMPYTTADGSAAGPGALVGRVGAPGAADLWITWVDVRDAGGAALARRRGVAGLAELHRRPGPAARPAGS